MSHRTKGAFWTILVLLVLLGILWWWLTTWLGGGNNAGAPATPGTSMNTTPSGAQPTSDNSDQSINQSLASVDSQMNGLTSDSAAVNKGLNDQPVPQQSL